MGSTDSIIEFDFGAWLKDTRTVSLAAKGAWIDILAAMWNSQSKGVLSLPWIGYSRLVGATVDQTKAVIAELMDHQVCSLLIDGEEVDSVNCADVTSMSHENHSDFTAKKEKEKSPPSVPPPQKRKIKKIIILQNRQAASTTRPNPAGICRGRT